MRANTPLLCKLMQDTARHNMIEQQLRTWEVLDSAVLSAYADDALRREDFIAAADKKPYAYADLFLPLGDSSSSSGDDSDDSSDGNSDSDNEGEGKDSGGDRNSNRGDDRDSGGRVMLEPKLEARMLQTLAPQTHENILHIGTGSGFFAALLGRFARRVTTLELDTALADGARARLAHLPYGNISVINADGAQGYADAAPYEAIVYTAALPQMDPLQESLAAQLTDGGRLLAIVGAAPAMKLRLFKNIGGQLTAHRDILETCIPYLTNAPAAEKFSF